MTEFIAHYRKEGQEAQSLQSHLLEVASTSKRNAGKIKLASVGEIIALLHDYGKYSLPFKRYIGSAEGLIDPSSEEYVDAKAMKGK